MPKPNKSKLYFPYVVAAPGGDAFLAGHAADQGTEPTFTRFAKAGDAGWIHLGDLGCVVCAAASMPTHGTPKPTILVLGRDGPLRIYRPGQAPSDVGVAPKDKSSYFEALCIASDGVYVCGGQRQIAHQSNDKWVWVDQGLFERFNGKNDCALFAMSEIADRVLLAVGSRGFVAVRDARGTWAQIDAGTNVDLRCVVAASDGGAWIGGDFGTLLRLGADLSTWTVVTDHSVSTKTFDSLALFGNQLYVTAHDKLLTFTAANGLQVASGPSVAGAEFHSVSSCDEYLWATGDEHAHRLGPDGWKHFLCPDNV
ncbi:MAG: hypothetical protein LKCHEGNO_00262 [Burkholderiaceae bacterium]|nr:hypothetical protein [Burkholderiaceae bacterium]